MLARSFGQTVFNFVTYFIPGIVVAFLFLDFRLPSSFLNSLLFILSIILGYAVVFSLDFLLGLLAIVTLNIQSIGWAYGMLVQFFAGQLVPIWLFPNFLRKLAEVLPFRCTFDIPMSIYIGKLSGASAWGAILKLVRIAVHSRMQYRADFLAGITSVVLSNGVSLALMSIMIYRFHDIHGWGLWDIVFLYNFFLLGHGINSVFFWHIRAIGQYIVEGTFDQFLIRPASPLIQLLGRKIQYLGLGDLMISVVAVTLAYMNLGLYWHAAHWIYFIICVFSGTVIEFCLSLMISCIAFWAGRFQSVFNVFWQFNLLVQQYPIDIFGRWFSIIVTGLIPVAFINYYPSVKLLGKTADLGDWAWLCNISPLVALLLLLMASFIWRYSIKHYASSGN